MSERRSGRPRKALDYSKLDGASDDEFFEDEVKTTKRKRKHGNDDEDWSVPVENPSSDACSSDPKRCPKEETKPKKATVKRKAPVSSIEANSKGVTENSGKENKMPSLISAPINQIASTVPTTPKTVSTSNPNEKNCSVVKHGISSPATPVSNNKPLYAVTPTSGLRLGLSRNQRLKSLHSNIRMA